MCCNATSQVHSKCRPSSSGPQNHFLNINNFSSVENQEQNQVRDADAVIEENQLQTIESPVNGRVQRTSQDEIGEVNQVTQF